MPHELETQYMSPSNKKKRDIAKNITVAWSIILLTGAIGFFTGVWPVVICLALLAWPLGKHIEKIYADKILSARDQLFSALDKTPIGKKLESDYVSVAWAVVMAMMNVRRAPAPLRLSHSVSNPTVPGTTSAVIKSLPPSIKPVSVALSPASMISLSLILVETYCNALLWHANVALHLHLKFFEKRLENMTLNVDPKSPVPASQFRR